MDTLVDSKVRLIMKEGREGGRKEGRKGKEGKGKRCIPRTRVGRSFRVSHTKCKAR